MESKAWKATWKRTGKKFTFALLEQPEITVTGIDVDETQEKLEDLIGEKFGDPAPYFEFLNPLPSEEPGGSGSYIQILAAHRSVTILNLDQLFLREKCKKCWNYPGPRSEALVVLERAPKDDLAGIDTLGQIISAQLAEFLRLNLVSEVTMRPVIIDQKETTAFLELCSRQPREFVAKKGIMASKGGFKCRLCGYGGWGYMPYEADYFEYVTKESLPDKSVKIFPIGTDYYMRLAVDRKIRAEIIRSKQFKNVVSRKVGVIAREQSSPFSAFFDY